MKKHAPKQSATHGKEQVAKKKTKSSPNYSQWAQTFLSLKDQVAAHIRDSEPAEPNREITLCKPVDATDLKNQENAQISPSFLASEDESDSPSNAILQGLYIVPTPIGNLGDITLRALDILSSVDVVACEDTRVTGGLLHRYGLKKHLLPYHDHNATHCGEEILKQLQKGIPIALVSDAGTPLISDPGYRLVCSCRLHDIPVTVLPGASAVLTGLAGSGLPTDRFLFAGFLPAKTSARRKIIQELSQIPATLVFYESPMRLAACLEDLAEVLGGARQVAMGRELTKLYEERKFGPLQDLAAHYAQTPHPPKGEIVLMIEPPSQTDLSHQDIDQLLEEALETQTVRDAAAMVAQKTGQKKSEIYQRALQLEKDKKS